MEKKNVRLITLWIMTILLLAFSIIFSMMLGIYCSKVDFSLFSIFSSIEEQPYYSKGAVATDNVFCSKVGLDVLKENGSAVDATIASSFCLGLINMHSSGIGGGGIMLVYSKKNKSSNIVDIFDYREEAPKNIMTIVKNLSFVNFQTGAYSIGVPGEVKGMHQAWLKYGRLPWPRLLKPTINIAESGFPMHRRLYEATNFMKSYVDRDPGLRSLLTKNGEVLKLGDLVKNAELARTLKIVSLDPFSFYNGSLANDVIEDLKAINSVIETDDLLHYQVKNPIPFSFDLKNKLKLFTASVPYGGPLVAYILNILSGFNLSRDSIENDKSMSEMYHRLIEAMKFAFAEKTLFADPDFMDSDVLTSIIKNLSNYEYGSSIRKLIDDLSHDYLYYHPRYDTTEDHGTTHLCTVDDDLAVSATNSINIWFGSAYRSPKTGIIYNNQMDDFSIPNHTNAYNLKPSPANRIKPGKRPVSSMSPIIILNGTDVCMIVGGSGGTRIITATASVIINKLLLDDTLDEAIHRPRVHHQLLPDFVVAEKNFPLPERVQRSLKQYYMHKLRFTNIPEYSAVQAIFIDEKKRIFAKSDPRKYGQAAGY